VDRPLTRRAATTLVLVAATVVATLAAWIWLAGGGLVHPHAPSVTPGAFWAAVVMWQAMMVAMMTPTVMPWVLAYGRLAGDGPAQQTLLAPLVFAGGYFAIWLTYSVAAAGLQMALLGAGVLGDGGPAPALAGVVLLAAGAFQFAPARQACLTHCRNPLSYLLSRWKGGPPAAFGLGVRHGAYCVGCCWMLMLTGFAVGLMNLAWMATLTLVMSLEQAAPRGLLVGRVFGVVLMIWGARLCWPA
jgi:predicted metal-binding membrane protein